MIARRLLLSRLKDIAPALAGSDALICFTGDHVVAFNDKIAISTPRTSTFKGCIPAALLIKLLASSRAAVVEITADSNGRVVGKLGSSTTFKLPVSPLAEFAQRFTMPAVPTQNFIKGIAGKFFAGIEHCVQSATDVNDVDPNLLGVTLIPSDNELGLFAGTHHTLSGATLPLPPGNGLKRHCILSVEFCRQMLRLAKRAQTTRLGVTGDHVMLAADDTLLWGRLIKSNNQPNYADVMARLLPKRYATQAVAAPHELEGILQLAKVIPDANIKITVADGEAALVSSEENGAQYEETLQLPKHPDVKLQVRARTLLDAYAAFAPENILFTKTCVVLTRNKLLRLVGAGPVAGADPVS